ncbi:MAG: hypothetical protein A2845_04490 [Candidatus Lloydbacteria bacterium RIFCSPHIGHO2_01_FULL_49_22]|uniref:Uncharacterized protein n=1 Tax=Candidatus Lloydbacteria bacterium RIFCSPHIGHO2_01_FULL_49_22 TaxID=1798658 RepID=A0A1G2CUB8_9BACT|nr:MAG: hypothetical protein A2845_04490 [Candidatus Lloydbacteria bacterium RIFCSPHIGHO2_01_FULL_49_22]OGZ08909.1 MAG: hypothetical protein A3C14_01525 [Candidatus Lloydbacteria bacterium RIFCSPHIGHO2_02_FULL_50_18]
MKLGIILQSNNPEHVWNAFRLGITALKAGNQASVFLLSEGSELDTIIDTTNFDISVKVAEFKALKGELLVCGTCIKMRHHEENAVCPISTMADLLAMIETSDKVVTF